MKKRCHFFTRARKWERRAYKTINNKQNNCLLMSDLTRAFRMSILLVVAKLMVEAEAVMQ